MDKIPDEAVQSALDVPVVGGRENYIRSILTAAIPHLPGVPSAARKLALEPDFWAVHSKTGVHVGLWQNKAHADEALREYEGGMITPLYRATPAHQEGFRQGIDAAAKLADYFEETIYSEGMSEDVYYGISCTVSQIARKIRALSSPDHADAGKVEGDGWLPIESAPKDGTVIQVWHQVHKCPVSVLWKDDGFPYRGKRLNWYERTYTTAWPEHVFFYWRPLPSAPSQEVAGS